MSDTEASAEENTLTRAHRKFDAVAGILAGIQSTIGDATRELANARGALPRSSAAEPEESFDELEARAKQAESELRDLLRTDIPALRARAESAEGMLAAVRRRLDRPVHPYGDETIPAVPEREFLRGAYGGNLVDDLDALLEADGLMAEPRVSFADRLLRQSDDAAEAKWGVRPNGTTAEPAVPIERVFGHGSIRLTYYPSSKRVGVVQTGENAVMDAHELVAFSRVVEGASASAREGYVVRTQIAETIASAGRISAGVDSPWERGHAAGIRQAERIARGEADR